MQADLRVVREHVVNAVHNVVQVPHQFAVRQIGFGVEDEPVEAVLGESEEEEAGESGEEGEGGVEALPRSDTRKHVSDDKEGQQDDRVPFVVREKLHEIRVEHPGRRHEQPMRRIYYLHVLLMRQLPDLGKQGAIRLDYP